MRRDIPQEDFVKTHRYAKIIGGALLALPAATEAPGRRGTSPTPGRMGGGLMSPTPAASSRSVPAGRCQIWIEGLPASRQPAPTDCETARRRAPSNARIIYGAGTTRGGVYYPNGKYDPRYDPKSSKYDPRHGRNDGRYGGQAYPGERGRGNDAWKAEHEREKYERKREKELRKREKELRKDAKKRGDHDDDRDGRWEGRRSTSTVDRPVMGPTTTTREGRPCLDGNRNGICDIVERTRGTMRP
jgi:hypothetical protein